MAVSANDQVDRVCRRLRKSHGDARNSPRFVPPACSSRLCLGTPITGKRLLSFFVPAYGLSWAYWIPLALAGIRTAPGSTATHEPGLLGPALAAFIVTGLTQGRVGLASLARFVRSPTACLMASLVAAWAPIRNR